MSSIHYIFDVDGTLTPSRKAIDTEFAGFFLNFCNSNSVSLVSGSDYRKTIEQLGEDICSSVQYVFSCSGNDVYDISNKTRQTRHLDHMPELETRLLELLEVSKFSLRTGQHIEYRPGGINFSIVGRSASFADRQQYILFDKLTGERKLLAETLTKEFPYLDITIGGETGVDIVAAGCNKSQIISHFDKDTTLVFFGDATGLEGNDYPLAKRIAEDQLGVVYTVSSWEDTYRLLLRI